MRLTFKRAANKALIRLHKGQPDKARAIREAIGEVAADPFAKRNNVKPLEGVEDGYRLRVGDWRVSYTIDRAGQVLDVFEIAHRGEAYR
jgi:mRNA interferase RelE/StbE